MATSYGISIDIFCAIPGGISGGILGAIACEIHKETSCGFPGEFSVELLEKYPVTF